MTIQIDAAEVEVAVVGVEYGRLEKATYRGTPFQFRGAITYQQGVGGSDTPGARLGREVVDSLNRMSAARQLEDQIAAMSAHARLEFFRLTACNKSAAAPNLRETSGGADGTLRSPENHG